MRKTRTHITIAAFVGCLAWAAAIGTAEAATPGLSTPATASMEHMPAARQIPEASLSALSPLSPPSDRSRTPKEVPHAAPTMHEDKCIMLILTA
ncbi:hypothetical protein [Streptomyces sp. NPDC020983]|uniref:hypothetical protein n=1 Tax=Streptomyces sp. NPDC020983 TaxID=3365106 RepID=UPI00379032CD